MAQPNVVASVHQRLLNKARDSGRPFTELLQYFAMERFLYRLSLSKHAGALVLKGALMLSAWRAPHTRPTKDIDFLGITGNDVENIESLTRDVCAQPVEFDDGLAFNPDSVVGERIVEDADYHGVRVRFDGSLGSARVRMQLDVGFGDRIVPAPEDIDYPTILDMPAPQLHGYSRETAIAEKVQAAVALDVLNSRMKDFYDIWLLCGQFDFDGERLAASIATTFETRRTTVVPETLWLDQDFVAAKQGQWNAFIRRSRLVNVPDLAEVVERLRAFLLPLLEALAAGERFSGTWRAPGPWEQGHTR